MENNIFAIIDNSVVTNAVVGENLIVLHALFPENELVNVTEETGPAYIGGTFENGIFIPPKPYESWLFNYEQKQWVAPKEYPTVAEGFYAEWDELNGDWAMAEFSNLAEES